MIAYECSRSRTHDCSWALTSPYKGCLSSIAAAIELGKHFIPSRYGVYQECRLPREGSQIQMIQGKNFCWLIVITSFTLSSLAQDSCNCCNIIFYCKFSTFDAFYVFLHWEIWQKISLLNNKKMPGKNFCSNAQHFLNIILSYLDILTRSKTCHNQFWLKIFCSQLSF